MKQNEKGLTLVEILVISTLLSLASTAVKRLLPEPAKDNTIVVIKQPGSAGASVTSREPSLPEEQIQQLRMLSSAIESDPMVISSTEMLKMYNVISKLSKENSLAEDCPDANKLSKDPIFASLVGVPVSGIEK
jgi:hypothetical protein